MWTDPATGYSRQSVSPRSGRPIELVEVELPAGAEIGYPADSYVLAHHQIWVLEGRLNSREGDAEHVLEAGDCLERGPPTACAYVNSGSHPCGYLVVLARR